MEVQKKRKLFIILCFYVTLSFQMPKCNMTHTASTFSHWSWQNASTEMQRQYRMLMEFERRKSQLVGRSQKGEVYSDLYVIRINDTEKVKKICRTYGFSFIRKVFADEDYYLFRHNKKKRHRRSSEFFNEVGKYSEVHWTSRQSLRDRVHRYLPFNSSRKLFLSKVRGPSLQRNLRQAFDKNLKFNDPMFKKQWYLFNSGQTGTAPENDINVLPVWYSGITGRGTTISVLDDGVCKNSQEVADNYDVSSSEEYLYLKKRKTPVPENSHGTYCAAIAAGVANNSVCGVGVAYEAKVGGVRILDGPTTDVQEALALVHALEHVDIYTASWGPSDQGRDVDGPGTLGRMAFIKGVTKGRKGKGSIYVWAAGNGGGFDDNCNLDGYASSPFTLTIGALTEDGWSTFYSEPCASVIASTYIGGSFHTPPFLEIMKTMDKKKIKVVVPEGRKKCKESFQGTSAAAPMAAGVVALALQANPDLTWRDIQHIIIRTSRIPDTDEDGWIINAGGFAFHPKIGAGVLDSHALVELARKWRTVRPLYIWTTRSKIGNKKTFRPNRGTSLSLFVQKSRMPPLHRIDSLETVIATINLQHLHCRDLTLILESPSGTPSQILTKRRYDNKTTEFSFWDFVSLHFWGEDPEGLWTLKIYNSNKRLAGTIDHFSLTLYGTKA